MLIGFIVALSAVTGVCVYLIERVDRPLRRAERLARVSAAPDPH